MLKTLTLAFVSFQNCMHESYTNSLQIHNDGVEEGGSNMDNKEPSGTSYNMLTIQGNKYLSPSFDVGEAS